MMPVDSHWPTFTAAFADGGLPETFGTTAAEGTQPTDARQARFAADATRIQAQREADQLEAARAAAQVAYWVWRNMPKAATPENCPHLAAKQVGGYGVKVSGLGHLVIPARDVNGELWTVQVVLDGEERFLAENLRPGTMHVVEPTGRGTLDTLARTGVLIVAERYAAAASIFEATGHPVIVAFDSANLGAAAEAVRAIFNTRPILIASADSGPRRQRAEEAAKAVGGLSVAPPLGAKERPADFNDLAVHAGSTVVRGIVEAALARLRNEGEKR